MRILLFFVLIFLCGCAHYYSGVPIGNGVTQTQLDQYQARALAALRERYAGSHSFEYDPSRPVRFWTENGKRPQVIVIVPTRNDDPHSANVAEVGFDFYSGELRGIDWVLIRDCWGLKTGK